MKLETSKSRSMNTKRWEGHIAPTGIPFAQQSPEQRRAYNTLMQRRSRAKYLERVGRSSRSSRPPPNPDAQSVNRAMALWK